MRCLTHGTAKDWRGMKLSRAGSMSEAAGPRLHLNAPTPSRGLSVTAGRALSIALQMATTISIATSVLALPTWSGSRLLHRKRLYLREPRHRKQTCA